MLGPTMPSNIATLWSETEIRFYDPDVECMLYRTMLVTRWQAHSPSNACFCIATLWSETEIGSYDPDVECMLYRTMLVTKWQAHSPSNACFCIATLYEARLRLGFMILMLDACRIGLTLVTRWQADPPSSACFCIATLWSETETEV